MLRCEVETAPSLKSLAAVAVVGTGKDPDTIHPPLLAAYVRSRTESFPRAGEMEEEVES